MLRRPVDQEDHLHPPAGSSLHRRPLRPRRRRRSLPQPPPRQRESRQPPQSHRSFPPRLSVYLRRV